MKILLFFSLIVLSSLSLGWNCNPITICPACTAKGPTGSCDAIDSQFCDCILHRPENVPVQEWLNQCCNSSPLGAPEGMCNPPTP